MKFKIKYTDNDLLAVLSPEDLPLHTSFVILEKNTEAYPWEIKNLVPGLEIRCKEKEYTVVTQGKGSGWNLLIGKENIFFASPMRDAQFIDYLIKEGFQPVIHS